MKNIYLPISIALITLSCGNNNVKAIIDESINSMGGELFNNAEIEFEFRDREYGYKKVDGQYEYIRLFNDSSQVVRDILTNDSFTREINGDTVVVADSMAVKYSNSINSVIYFAFLPYGLNAKAVNKEYISNKIIKGQNYHKIKVTFDEEGGGEDYQDVFIYWVNEETNFVDYLAYEYRTDGGGMRFREAYNDRVVNGIRFVDYINYEPKQPITLMQIDDAFVSNELNELSKIELKKIKVNSLK